MDGSYGVGTYLADKRGNIQRKRSAIFASLMSILRRRGFFPPQSPGCDGSAWWPPEPVYSALHEGVERYEHSKPFPGHQIVPTPCWRLYISLRAASNRAV
jgi:hypothetical protein